MLEKFLAKLPYNPNLVQQFAFYAKRLHQEKAVRRIGLFFVLLAFFVQFFAFISPPQATMARSNNDLIDGGISGKTDATTYCKNNTASYGTILSYYGISCSDISAATTVSLKSTAANGQLYSMGRLPYGLKGETPVNISGKTYYWRYLDAWDSGPYSTYTALQGKSSVTGKTFYILFNCGNLVFVGLPAPPARCQWDSSIYASSSACVPPKCALDKSLPADSPNCKACPYNSGILKNNAACVQCPYPGLGTITKGDAKCIPPCPYNSAITTADAACKPCSAAQTQDDKTACLELSKSAKNDTQNIADANGTTANAGDTITYTLYVKNDGKATVPKFVIQENLSDVLDYADVVDLHGGTLSDTQIVSYPAQDIKAGETATEQITVKIKNPIPTTPASTSDPGHYDNTLTNVYGNTVNIKLPPNVVQTTSQLTTTLPNTGPGTSVFIGFIITAFVGFLFARTRLLSKETDLALRDPVTNGSMPA